MPRAGIAFGPEVPAATRRDECRRVVISACPFSSVWPGRRTSIATYSALWSYLFAFAHDFRNHADPLWVALTTCLFALVAIAAMSAENRARQADSLRVALGARTRELDSSRADFHARLERAKIEVNVLERRSTELQRSLQELETRLAAKSPPST